MCSVLRRRRKVSNRPTNRWMGPSLVATSGGQHCHGGASSLRDPPCPPVLQTPGFLKSRDKTTVISPAGLRGLRN